VKHLTVLLFIALGCAMRAEAQDVVGKVFSLQGSAEVVRSGSTVSLSEGAEVHTGDEVQVGDPGRVALELTDGSYIRLPAGAKMRFPAKSGSLDLLDGSLHFFSHSEQHPNVVTEHVTAAIRGTEFVVKTDRQSSSISMFSGSVDGASEYGRVSLAAGHPYRLHPHELRAFGSMEHVRSVYRR